MPQQHVTRQQLQNFYNSIKSDAKIPTSKLVTWIAFPKSPEFQFNTLIVKKTKMKSGDGKVLFSMEFKNV
jgi:hypothetical protein